MFYLGVVCFSLSPLKQEKLASIFPNQNNRNALNELFFFA